MILRVNKGDDVVTVKTMLRMCSGSRDIILGGEENNKITIENSEETFETWYNKFLSRKRESMLKGGQEEIQVEDNQEEPSDEPSYTYNFEQGLINFETTWVKSIESAEPTTDGNIQLLPGLTLDIVPSEEDNKIIFSRIELDHKTIITDILEDINNCAWYLYHTFNSFLYRLNVWSPNTHSRPMFPESRLLGTITAYQAAVAAWNIKLWRKSFLWEMSPVRENISFSIGYMAISCVNPKVTCKVTIKNLKETIGEGERNDTTKFLTIYAQGVSSNRSDVATRRIEKIGETGATTLSGTGDDDMVVSGEDWDSITITVDIGSMNQGDYYKAAFSLAVGQSEDLANYYTGSSNVFNRLQVDTIWLIDTEECGFVTNVDVPALKLVEPDDEDYLR